MGLNCSQYSYSWCCGYSGYSRRQCFRRGCWPCWRRNKTSPGDSMDRSPPPSIALTIAGANKSQADEQSIQDQLSLFHFGQGGSSPSGRRYSHPNQAKWVEEYQRRKSNPGSPSASVHPAEEYPDDNSNSPLPSPTFIEVQPEKKPPPNSGVMEYPVVPPGRLT